MALVKTKSLDNAILELWLAMLSKYGNCTYLLKINNKLRIGCFYKYSQEEFSLFCGRF